jgi:tRNA dimethylallyltransferase
MPTPTPPLLVVLGPTASGKTRLAVFLARALHGEIISADSRQVYRGLDIGSGKDLSEYGDGIEFVPYHVIDLAELHEEFNVFAFQRAFLRAFADITGRGRLPVLAGGTGLYLEAALARDRMAEVPENPALRADLDTMTDDELRARLCHLKPDLHNTTDLTERTRLLRAIEIAEFAQSHPPEPMPQTRPLILGTRWDSASLRARIARRLHERLDAGLVDEVDCLRKQGVSAEKLHFLGLEYRHVNDFLEGRIRNRNDLFQKLNSAIAQFARRQQSWFRRMERQGHVIHWIDGADPAVALRVVRDHIPGAVSAP